MPEIVVPSPPGFYLALYNAPDKGGGVSYLDRRAIIAWRIVYGTPSDGRFPITFSTATDAWSPEDTAIIEPDGRVVRDGETYRDSDEWKQNKDPPRRLPLSDERLRAVV